MLRERIVPAAQVRADTVAKSINIYLTGWTGSGKTFGATIMANEFKKHLGGEILFIDTEPPRGAHLANEFDYQYAAVSGVSEMAQACTEIVANPEGYYDRFSVVIVDGLSEPWNSIHPGIPELARKQFYNDGGAAWGHMKKIWKEQIIWPLARCGKVVLATSRAKVLYEMQDDTRTGKKKRIAIGTDSIGASEDPYEHAIILYLSQNHRVEVTKGQSIVGADELEIIKPKLVDTILAWMRDAPKEAAPGPSPKGSEVAARLVEEGYAVSAESTRLPTEGGPKMAAPSTGSAKRVVKRIGPKQLAGLLEYNFENESRNVLTDLAEVWGEPAKLFARNPLAISLSFEVLEKLTKGGEDFDSEDFLKAVEQQINEEVILG